MSILIQSCKLKSTAILDIFEGFDRTRNFICVNSSHFGPWPIFKWIVMVICFYTLHTVYFKVHLLFFVCNFETAVIYSVVDTLCHTTCHWLLCSLCSKYAQALNNYSWFIWLNNAVPIVCLLHYNYITAISKLQTKIVDALKNTRYARCRSLWP